MIDALLRTDADASADDARERWLEALRASLDLDDRLALVFTTALLQDLSDADLAALERLVARVQIHFARQTAERITRGAES